MRSAFGAASRVLALAALGVMAAPSSRSTAATVTAAAPVLAGWQRLLDDHLTPLRLYDTDRSAHIASSMFDYRGLITEPSWSARLDSVRQELCAAPPSRMSPADRLAWAIDTYNFLVVDRITREFAARAASHGTFASVQDVKGFFDAPAVELEGTSYSLDTFEHHFVFLDVDRGEGRPLPAGFDPRAHFALVCGARGCPPLWPSAFRGATLAAQLDSVTLDALHAPAHLRWDPVRRVLQASELFAWFEHDFGGPEGVMDFIMKHAPSDVSQDLDRYRVSGPSESIPWDWALNQRP